MVLRTRSNRHEHFLAEQRPTEQSILHALQKMQWCASNNKWLITIENDIE